MEIQAQPCPRAAHQTLAPKGEKLLSAGAVEEENLKNYEGLCSV